MKVDTMLGQKVQQYLIGKGVETPMKQNLVPEHQQIAMIAESFGRIMSILGLDLNDDSLSGTPDRVGHMYVTQMFSGLNYRNFPKCTTVQNKMNYDEMVVVDEINMQSNCEHHFVIIDGFVKIGYIPKDRVLGLSKINRIVKFFSRRPQIQERLGEQIFHALSFILDTEDVAVVIKATHFCVKARGVEDQTSKTTTSKIGGRFKDLAVRNEFFSF